MSLRLSDQLCFPFYAITHALGARYRPLLAPLGLTYPQYLVMMVLWEEDNCSVRRIAERVHVDSPTLTPLLKRLEASGFVTRQRDKADNRLVRIRLTAEGRALQARAAQVPYQLVASLRGTEIDLPALKQQLDSVMRSLDLA